MDLWMRFRAAAAAFRGKSATARESVAMNQLLDFLGVDRMVSKTAMSEAVYYACVKVLSESIGKLPLKIQQHTPENGVRVAREHPYYRMLNERPNRYMTASTFWSMMERCRSDQGNGYAWIDTRDPRRPQLWPIDPGAVEVWYDDARRLDEAPDVYYRVSTKKGVLVLGSEDVLHLKSFHTIDGLVGIPTRQQLQSTIQGNINAQNYINKLYQSGMTAKAVLQYTGSLNDANVDILKKGMEAYVKGDIKNSGIENIIPVPTGMTLTPLNLKLADSQFLEIRQYSALQIASAFGVKPYQVGDYTKSSYASAEAQQLSFLIDTLLFIVKQYEEEIGYKLLSDEEAAGGYHVKFNTGVILRADQKTQIETLRSAVGNFLMTPNEAREKLDLPNKPGGDRLIGNGNAVPLEDVGKQYTQQAAQEDDPPEDDDKPEGDQPAQDAGTDDHKDDSARKEEKGWTKKPTARRGRRSRA